MGFSIPFFSSSPSEKAAEEVRTGARFPTREERKRCWDARDSFFACLDRSAILDAEKDPKATTKACAADESVFERDCAKEWVSYFKKWRVADHQKKQRMAALEAQGAQSIGMELGPGGKPT